MKRYEIINFDDTRVALEKVGDVAALHSELLSHSPVVVMGVGFMEKFYYRALITERLVCGAIAYVDDEPAGFIVATDVPGDFMKLAFRRHWFSCLWQIMVSTVRRPSRAIALYEAYSVQRDVEGRQFPPSVGEILSFGVRRKFRSRKFVKETDLHLSTDLLTRVCDQLVERGMTSARAVIDEDNLEAKLFYKGRGWRLGSHIPTGWSVPSCEFIKEF